MKILLIEDDTSASDLISATLSAHRYAVDTITDGFAGLEMASQWDYDLILLDVLLPKLDGIEVCRRLRLRGCKTPILMLTMKNSNEDIIAGLDAGADDYLAKTCDPSQLLARVRALLRRGGSEAAQPLLTWEHLCLDPARAWVTYNQEPVSLRPKEYTLLELFLRHPRRIFSRSAIIDHLWSIDDTPVEGAITNLIKDLRHRLKSAGMRTDLIETVYGLGYRLREACPEQTQEYKEGESNRDRAGLVAKPVLAMERGEPVDDRQQRGVIAIQRIKKRFLVSLDQRIAALESADRSLQTGRFNLEQLQTARVDAHKLAGGLGTFGCSKASEVAQAIEHLLETSLSQEALLADQLPQLLEELKQEIANPLNEAAISEEMPSVTILI